MKTFEILEHKADLKIRVFGKTKEELFKNAVLAMTSGLRPKIKNLYSSRWLDEPNRQISKIKNVKIESADLETLLVDFLSEVLYLTQVNKEVYQGMRFIKFSDTEIEAELQGKKVESFGEDIKAVTYHNLEVRQKKDGTWEATVLFDV